MSRLVPCILTAVFSVQTVPHIVFRYLTAVFFCTNSSMSCSDEFIRCTIFTNCTTPCSEYLNCCTLCSASCSSKYFNYIIFCTNCSSSCVEYLNCCTLWTCTNCVPSCSVYFKGCFLCTNCSAYCSRYLTAVFSVPTIPCLVPRSLSAVLFYQLYRALLGVLKLLYSLFRIL